MNIKEKDKRYLGRDALPFPVEIIEVSSGIASPVCYIKYAFWKRKYLVIN